MNVSESEWFWAPPARQPIIGRKATVLMCRTRQPLNLPQVCCSCGRSKGKYRKLRVVELTKREAALGVAEALTGHAGHVVAAVRMLTEQKVQIPCCSMCRSLHRWGMVAGIMIILLAVAVFASFASLDQDTKLKMPVWQDFVVVVGAFVLVIIGGVVSAWFTWKSFGVLVYRFADGLLYYEFWSSKYHEYLKTRGPHDTVV
jgi:hypothetical protein